jgi:hypothetical protein
MRECRSAKVRKIIALRARAAKLDADYEGGAGSPGAHEAPGAAAARRGPDAQGSAHRLRAGGAPAGVERGVAPTQMGYPAELDVRVSLRPGAGVSPAVRERGRPMAGPPPPRRGPEILPVTLTKDGRLVDRVQLERVAKAAGSVTDCFLFCHGWLYDEAEARQESACFFALLDGVLAPLRARIVPLRLGLHWPSKPFAAVPLTRDRLATGLWPELERGCAARSRRGASHSDLALLLDLCAAEIPRSSEEDAELDALVWQLTRSGRERGAALPVSPLHALSFWVMKRRAGEVGERFAREWMVPLWRSLARPPRLHLIGHSFGATLVTSMALGGVRPASITLLFAAFSAFAFALSIPGFRRPGFYYPVLAERRVDGPIVVLRSDHDAALGAFYRTVTGSGAVDLGSTRDPGRPVGLLGRAATIAASALGAVGARGVGAPELDLLDVQRTGIPRYPIVNVDGSRVVKANGPLLGAHGDIFRREIATLAGMAAGLLVGGPAGARPVPLDPLVRT